MSELPPVKRFITRAGVRVYRIAFRFMPDLSGRVHLVLGAGPPTLVDAGSWKPEALNDILDGFEIVRSQFGESVRLPEIARILLTHTHVDHRGGLAELVRRTGAAVGVHPLEARAVAAWDERMILARGTFETFLGRAGVDPQRWQALLDAHGGTSRRMESIPVDFLLEDGQDLDGLHVLHTPGHSPGHICLQVDNILLTGDHVLARTITQQWPETLGSFMGLAHYLESLARVRRIGGIDVALGGHEPPIPDLASRIDVIRSSQIRRLDRLMAMLEAAREPMTIAEMTARTYAPRSPFYEYFALSDVAARVEYCDQRGRLAVANIDQVQRDPHVPYRYVAV